MALIFACLILRPCASHLLCSERLLRSKSSFFLRRASATSSSSRFRRSRCRCSISSRRLTAEDGLLEVAESVDNRPPKRRRLRLFSSARLVGSVDLRRGGDVAVAEGGGEVGFEPLVEDVSRRGRLLASGSGASEDCRRFSDGDAAGSVGDCGGGAASGIDTADEIMVNSHCNTDI